MNVFLIILGIIAYVSVLCKAEKVSLFYLTPFNIEDEQNDQLVHNNDTLPIPLIITGEKMADALDQQTIVGFGQEFSHTKLENNKIYAFTKVSEQECHPTPFYYNKEKDVSFYLDSCNYYVYTCNDKHTQISSNSDDLFNVRNLADEACKEINADVANENELEKRCSKEDEYAIYESMIEAGLTALATFAFEGPTPGFLYSLMIAATISTMDIMECYGTSENQDKCCWSTCSGYGPSYYCQWGCNTLY